MAPNSTGPAAVVQREFEVPGAPNFDGGLIVENAPADADVSVLLFGGTKNLFEITALNVYERRAVPGRPATVPDLVVSSDGSSLVSVKAGQLVYVGVVYHAPDRGFDFNMVLYLRGSSWNVTPVRLSFQLPS